MAEAFAGELAQAVDVEWPGRMRFGYGDVSDGVDRGGRGKVAIWQPEKGNLGNIRIVLFIQVSGNLVEDTK